MATTYEYLDYTIWLPNAEQVKELQQGRARIESSPGVISELNPSRISDPGALYVAPATAAGMYGAQILTPQMPNIPPSITSEWIISNTNNVNYPLDEWRFERKSGGWFGISWLFGDTKVYRWRGTFQFRAKEPTIGETPVPGAAVMPVRYWVDGFETSAGGFPGVGASYNAPQLVSRDASRHTGGYGLRVTGAMSASAIAHRYTEHGRTAPSVAWQRFYIRVRKLPNTTTKVWYQNCSGGASRAVRLVLTPNGALGIESQISGSVDLFATTALQLVEDRWYKIDLLFECGANSYCKLYVDGALLLNVTGFPTNGFGTVGSTLADSGVERENVSGRIYAWDLDDWMCADHPLSFDSLDWLNGTRVMRLPPAALAPSHDAADWSVDYRAGNQYSALENSQVAVATGATPASELAFRMELEYLQDRGCIAPTGALVATLWASNAPLGSVDHVTPIGYAIDGVPVQENRTLLANNYSTNPHGIMRDGGGTVLGETWTSLDIFAIHEAGTNITTVRQLAVEVELVGNWGREDVSAESTDATDLADRESVGRHVAPYPYTPWAYKSKNPPVAPVAIVATTYVGDGSLMREFTFDFPPTFIFIRPNIGTPDNFGTFWWTSMNNARQGHPIAYRDALMYRARANQLTPATEDDAAFNYKVNLGGNIRATNNSGDTYSLFAFCDPGMRFSLNAAFANQNQDDLPTRLPLTTFLPEFAFIQDEQVTATTNGGFAKGLAAGGDTIVPLSAVAAITAGMTFAQGVVTRRSSSPGASSSRQVALAMFRRDDGSGDPGVSRVVRLLGYTGDGSASRTIAIDMGGRRPLWAMIVPHNAAAAVWRDPENTGTTSNQSGTTTYSTNASTGITAGGIDQITVGSALNSNGVNYDLIVFPGDTTAGNNGWSIGGTFIPVEPVSPVEWPGGGGPIVEIPTPLPPEWIEGGGGTTPTLPVEPGGSDFGTQCVPASSKVCAQALAVIGITTPISDITTDASPDANMCRLFYSDIVNETLRDFPWPVFTKYADLPRVYGTQAAPYNGDWTYAYRAPADMIAARRIVREGYGRTFDPDPPQFRMGGSDATGRLIQSKHWNPETVEPAVTVELEYTYRPDCAAAQGDALFREALVYKLASKLAPALARNKITAQDCLAAYEHVKARARVAAANELQQGDGEGDALWIRGRG